MINNNVAVRGVGKREAQRRKRDEEKERERGAHT
jgi:hypothetical protein